MMKRFCILITVFLSVILALGAQTKPRLAILPFTGGRGGDGETISVLLSNQRILRDAFTVQPRNSAIDRIMTEQQYQRQSGLINSDAISEIGKLNTADLVVSGHITNLSNNNLVIISIIDVTEIQQVAGVYKTYRNIEEIRGLLPDIAKGLVETSLKNKTSLPGLAVPSFTVPSGVNANDAMVLAQILATELAASGKYAVFPRNKSVDDVKKEIEFQRSGMTSGAAEMGTTRKIEYILSSNVMSLGKTNLFGTQILNIEKGNVIEAADREYQDISDGLSKNLMSELAKELMGGTQPPPPPPNFVRVEGGSFQMGGTMYDDEKPIHTVTVKSFSISKYQVTQKEWYELMGTTVRQQRDMADKSWSIYGEGDNYPIYYVNWNEAVEYCNKRSLKEGLTPAYRGSAGNISCDWNANGYRLPTEAEWEFAAKGGIKEYMTTEYAGSNSAGAVAWYADNSGRSTHPVGTKAPNSLGLYDMSGNVWEWCWDWYGGYTSGIQTDPRGAASGASRVMRGGSWSYSAGYVRSAYRSYVTPSFRNCYIGFRLVRP
jgi:formylglycine-generating enzyme required for sulfatase activity